MSLNNTLLQSIAALDRITSLDHRQASDAQQDEEKSIHSIAASSYTSSQFQNEARSIRRCTSEPSLRYSVAISEKVPSLHSDMSSPREETDDYEPKLTLRYVAAVTRDFFTVLLPFINPAIAICIIGLAADNIDWAGGRGSVASNTVNAVFIRDYNATAFQFVRTVTRMNYLPMYYDTQTFSAMIVAGAVCTVGAFIVAPLSVVHWWSTGRSVKLTNKKRTSQFRILLACVVLDAIMFLVAVIIIIYARELFTTYDRWDRDGKYSLNAKYLKPPLPPVDLADESWDLIDDEIRYYWSPVHYNPMNWNCRFQGHVSSSMQHRIFELCNEGVAARDLLAVLVAFQGLVLVLHGWACWTEKNAGGGIRWLSQRLGSEERITGVPAQGERSE